MHGLVKFGITAYFKNIILFNAIFEVKFFLCLNQKFSYFNFAIYKHFIIILFNYLFYFSFFFKLI